MKSAIKGFPKKLKIGVFFALIMTMMSIESLFFHAWSWMVRAVFLRSR